MDPNKSVLKQLLFTDFLKDRSWGEKIAFHILLRVIFVMIMGWVVVTLVWH